MKFWDASALVPLLVEEPETARARAIRAADPEILVWWGTQVECASALSRLDRIRALDSNAIANAFGRLAQIMEAWVEIEPNELVRDSAIRFLRVHPLRAADALQLAAAFVASDHRPLSLQFVTFDERLASAARKEGFRLVGEAAG